MSHHTLLHNDAKLNPYQNAGDLQCFTVASFKCVVPAAVPSENRMVRLMMVPVRVSGNDSTHFVDTYALLDAGSDISLCTTSLTRKLKLRGERVTKKLVGMTGSRIERGFVVPLNIRGLNP